MDNYFCNFILRGVLNSSFSSDNGGYKLLPGQSFIIALKFACITSDLVLLRSWTAPILAAVIRSQLLAQIGMRTLKCWRLHCSYARPVMEGRAGFSFSSRIALVAI